MEGLENIFGSYGGTEGFFKLIEFLRWLSIANFILIGILAKVILIQKEKIKKLSK